MNENKHAVDVCSFVPETHSRLEETKEREVVGLQLHTPQYLFLRRAQKQNVRASLFVWCYT